jgi:ribonucleoside-diphosphate reductase alpha chain
MLPTQYQEFIHLSRYARWNEEEARRETWDETSRRYFNFFAPHLNDNHDAGLGLAEVNGLFQAVNGLEVMPSMRALMTAGPALSRDHVSGYNCAYVPVDDVRAFDEIMFVLMCATGVGFSVERQFVNQLPCIPEDVTESTSVIQVRDSKRGWSEAYRELLGSLYVGRIPEWDDRKVRPAGARLKTMGGRASGPDPLRELVDFTIHTFKNAAGRKLTSVECHDICCKIGECVVVGGVRRSALISLSNLSDHRMRDAKSGEWWVLTPHRYLSNNSVAYTETPEVGQFMEEWLSLYQSKSGERGIFNREAAIAKVLENGRRKASIANGVGTVPIDFGTNPCGEIILRPQQFCNLSTVVVHADDSERTLIEKVEKATVLGTWQSTLTNFRYIRAKWKQNCEEERLLGVSMTGIMSNRLLNGRNDGGLKRTAELLQDLKQVAIETNKKWSDRLGIQPSAAITCVKPEGTATQLVGADSSGIHAAFAPYYLRRIRQDKKDPITQLMIDQGVPHEQDVMNPENIVFEFPSKANSDAVFRDDMSAIENLEHWKVFRDSWCEHNPSISIHVKEHEWPEVGGWVYRHFDKATGLTFVPHSDHVYKQAPYEEITVNEYNARAEHMPGIDWSKLGEYEQEDTTKSSHELACVGGVCELHI